MPVDLLLVACKGQVLVQDHTPSLKQNQVVKKLVDSMNRADSKNSYAYEGSTYHCLVENEILYFCVTDPDFTTLNAYSLLNDLKTQFKAQFSPSGSALRVAELNPTRCASFASVLQKISRSYTENPNRGNKMGKLKDDIEVVKAQMVDNLDSIVQRGGDIGALCDKTEMLAEDAHVFEGESRRLKNKMLWKNIKLAIVIFICLVLLGIVIGMFACGVTFQDCKKKHTSTQAPGTTHTPATQAPK